MRFVMVGNALYLPFSNGYLFEVSMAGVRGLGRPDQESGLEGPQRWKEGRVTAIVGNQVSFEKSWYDIVPISEGSHWNLVLV